LFNADSYAGKLAVVDNRDVSLFFVAATLENDGGNQQQNQKPILYLHKLKFVIKNG